MSGGSYNYLYAQDAEMLVHNRMDIEDMLKRLQGLGWTKEITKTEKVLEALDKLKEVLHETENIISECTEVWHAVEWHDSCDGSALFDKLEKEYKA